MTWSALPDHLNTPEKVEAAFPDDSQYEGSRFGDLFKRFHKVTKPWTAFGPRAKEWWANWRQWPITLFAARGSGRFRMEDDRMEIVQWRASSSDIWINYLGCKNYLSRIQFYCQWSIQLQWPLLLACHFYVKGFDVPIYGEEHPETDGKLWFFYIGAHRDADKVYWFPSAYIGRNWK